MPKQAEEAARLEEARRKEAKVAERQARLDAELARNRELLAECAFPPPACNLP